MDLRNVYNGSFKTWMLHSSLDHTAIHRFTLYLDRYMQRCLQWEAAMHENKHKGRVKEVTTYVFTYFLQVSLQ